MTNTDPPRPSPEALGRATRPPVPHGTPFASRSPLAILVCGNVRTMVPQNGAYQVSHFPQNSMMADSRLGVHIAKTPPPRHVLPYLILGVVCVLCPAPTLSAEGPKSVKDDDYRQFEMLVDAIDQV